MEQLPFFTHLLIGLSAVFVIFQLYRATGRSRTTLLVLLAWAAVTGWLGTTGFYRQEQALPPRFIFLVGPGVVLTLLLIGTRRGQGMIQDVRLTDLTLLQAVRLPVELVLYQLYAATLVPQIMTFSGANFDILTGLTAPVVGYLAFYRRTIGTSALLLWNLAGLGLLLVIMTLAILSIPTPFQQLGLDQPNVGVAYFPFVWLPGIIVPAALFAHLASLRQLISAYRERRSSVLPRPRQNPVSCLHRDTY